MANSTRANIRMYRLNELGDCFLVSLAAGDRQSHLLIDCGSFRNDGDSVARLREIVAQIKNDLNGAPLDVVVGTHQHNDHLSGFVHCEAQFKEIGVKEVWLSWLDNPQDELARKVGERFHNLRMQLTEALPRLRRKLKGAAGGSARTAQRAVAVLEDMLGFFGVNAAAKTPPKIPAEATAILKQISGKKPEYLKPGEVREMPGLPDGAVRIHVFGPPREETPLYRKDPRKGESYDHELAIAVRAAATFARATQDESASSETDYPFGGKFKVRAAGSQALKEVQKRYNDAGDAWRTIDHDWMQQAEALGLYLDTYTNNSSLVLAIELVESKKVLLFAADAQTGNWDSWRNIAWPPGHPGTAALLARTVFYKVGHHASHNATLRDVFDNMGSAAELCALIPVHKQDANIRKKNGWKMPATKLFKRLVERTNGRVLQMDDVNPPECDLSKPAVAKAWAAIGVKPKVTEFSIELEIK